MEKISIFLLLLCVFIVEIENKPVESTSGKSCFDFLCPQETTACEKRRKISKDAQYINTDVNCLSKSGETLKSYSHQEENPYMFVKYFEGYTFTNVGLSEQPQPDDVDPIKITHNSKKDEIETFD